MTTTATTPTTTPRSPGGAAADRAHHPDDLDPAPQIDMAEHRQTYRWFVRGTLLFAAHAVGILLVLAYVFSDGFG